MTLATLADAIDWARSRWDNQRTPSLKLHKWETEGVGLYYSPPFAHALDAPIHASAEITTTVNCYHPLLFRGQSPLDCPECQGHGIKDVRVHRYLYPMSVALNRLHNGLRPPRQPHPYQLVIHLAAHNWQPRAAAETTGMPWDRAEPLFLMSLRRLHAYYSEGPMRTTTSAPTWIDKSDSQRAAETAA